MKIFHRMQNLVVVIGLSLSVGAPALASEVVILAPAKRKAMADFELGTIKGAKAKLSDQKNKVVAVAFWATWCEPCKQELYFLNQFRKKYGDKGFEVLAVAADAPETLARVRTTVRRKKWNMPVLLDLEGKVANLINPRGAMPYSIFVDRKQRRVYSHEGFSSGDEVKYEKLILSLIDETI